jgi:hypothetical protein
LTYEERADKDRQKLDSKRALFSVTIRPTGNPTLSRKDIYDRLKTLAKELIVALELSNGVD